jgi:hypothetical protein
MKAEREAGSRNIKRPSEHYTRHITLWWLRKIDSNSTLTQLIAQNGLIVYFRREIMESFVPITNSFCNDMLIPKGKMIRKEVVMAKF